MNLSKKKKIAIIIAMSTIIVTSVSLSIFYYYHPTHYKYNDRFIIGNSVEAITERYGEFDMVKECEDDSEFTGMYLVKSGKNYTFMGLSGVEWPEYYTIEFENGKATYVYIWEYSIGG